MASVFFSYSHKDEALRNELEAHLALLKHQRLIDAWHDRRIVGGDDFDDAIMSNLDAADIILLLVSSDFINSAYCYSREMMRAMERHNAGQARVIPIILRHCDWTRAPFGHLLAAPRDGKPIVSWPDRDDAMADVAKQVRKAVEALGTGSAIPVSSTQPWADGQAGKLTEPMRPLPRSSNLRLKQEFTEMDVDRFLRASFEFVCRYFEGSIGAIGERNADVQGTFEQIDSRRMAAMLYRRGKKLAACSVFLGGPMGGNTIGFSYNASAATGSVNEMLSVEAGEQSLHFKPMGLALHGGGRQTNLSQQGAAEYLWELFITRAQA